MNFSRCTFKIGCASYTSLVEHLESCADLFCPPLSSYVVITDYARKILANATTFEAWVGCRLVGLVAVYFDDSTATGFITNVSVVREFQHRGIASELIRQVIEFARSRSCKRLDLEVSVDNAKALRLYSRIGFVVVDYKTVGRLRLSYNVVSAEASNGK